MPELPEVETIARGLATRVSGDGRYLFTNGDLHLRLHGDPVNPADIRWAMIQLPEQGSGKPDALLTWFYPGCLTGHEFRYSAREEKQLAQARQQTIVVNSKATNSAVQAGD